MRRLFFAVLASVSLCGDAWAWGDTGHEIVCEIAYRVAAPKTRSEVRRLIRMDSDFDFFREACTWPDHPRKRASEHFVNLPRDAASIGSDDCPLAEKCVLTAIASDLEVLSSSTSSREEKLAALKFLGHWVGDVHQPLHVSFEDDRGGNEISVTGVCSSNLHSTWDTCLVLQVVSDNISEAATGLLASLTPAQKEQWIASEPRDWANESFAVAKSAQAKYCAQHGSSCDLPTSDVDVDTAYIDANKGVVREQLTKAGIRLGHLLDTALGQ